jgi:hypothetical protein
MLRPLLQFKGRGLHLEDTSKLHAVQIFLCIYIIYFLIILKPRVSNKISHCYIGFRY